MKQRDLPVRRDWEGAEALRYVETGHLRPSVVARIARVDDDEVALVDRGGRNGRGGRRAARGRREERRRPGLVGRVVAALAVVDDLAERDAADRYERGVRPLDDAADDRLVALDVDAIHGGPDHDVTDRGIKEVAPGIALRVDGIPLRVDVHLRREWPELRRKDALDVAVDLVLRRARRRSGGSARGETRDGCCKPRDESLEEHFPSDLSEFAASVVIVNFRTHLVHLREQLGVEHRARAPVEQAALGLVPALPRLRGWLPASCKVAVAAGAPRTPVGAVVAALSAEAPARPPRPRPSAWSSGRTRSARGRPQGRPRSSGK